MSIFDLFRWKVEHEEKGPNIKFGRYSDAFKDEIKHKLYEDAIAVFEDGDAFQSVILLLDFLRDDNEDNVQYDVEGDELFFEILQGSKRIIGRCNHEKFAAISEVAMVLAPNIGLYRRLLEKNYLLKYVRFCLNDDNQLALKFDSFMKDASPKKLYRALRELSINSDKYDDILVDEFTELSETNTGQIVHLTDEVKASKAAYVRSQLQHVLKQIAGMKGHSESFQNGISYLLLFVNYKLDYLVKPEGFIMDVLERNHRLFFFKANQIPEKKNRVIIQNFEKILDRTDFQIMEECYETIHTFGYLKASSHEQLIALINDELPKMMSYLNTRQYEMAYAVAGYIVCYGLFNFGFPPPDIDLLNLALHIIEQDYFKEIGFMQDYRNKEQLNKKIILSRIDQIVEKHQELYPEFRPDKKDLNFDNMFSFLNSFLNMFKTYSLHYRGHIA